MEYIKKGSEVLMNTYGHFPVCIDHGEGVYLYGNDGKKYLDFVAGIAVNSLGSAHPALTEAITKQAAKLMHCSNLYYTQEQLKLAEILTENTDFDKVFFCNSGAEAVEGALKLARKYQYMKKPEDGQSAKNEIIAMKGSFHGRTFGSLSVTAQPKYQEAFRPMLPGVKYADFNDFDSVLEAACENTAAIITEVIQGEGGLIPAEKDFLVKLRTLCDEKDIVLIFDEIQSGAGRSGELYAYQAVGVTPDIITSAKGLAGGIPVGAILACDKVASAAENGDHGSTFGGNPLTCAAGLAVMNEILNNGILENVKECGKYLTEKLNALKEKYPVIKEVRGFGLMQGIELDTAPKDIISKCIENGLLLVGAGTNVIRFVPPLIIEKEHIDEMADILDRALAES